jgi:hypothetical protein
MFKIAQIRSGASILSAVRHVADEDLPMKDGPGRPHVTAWCSLPYRLWFVLGIGSPDRGAPCENHHYY